MPAGPSRILSASLIAVRFAAVAVVMVLALPGAAEPDPEASLDLEALTEDREAKARKYPLSPRVSRYLTTAAELLDEKEGDEAEELLVHLGESRLNPYERAYVRRMLGVVAYTSEDPEKAIGYFDQVLDLEMLPLRDEAKIRFTIAQLNAQLERWPEVVRRIDEWLRYVESPDAAGIYLKALAYHQMGETDAAIENVKLALELSEEPRESWMRMLYALYTQKEDYASATPVLKELLVRFPKKEYWTQLSLLYRAREDFEESLAAQQAAYAQGFLTEDKELRRLARSYLFHELPYLAAQVLEKGIAEGRIEPDAEAYRVLADCWVTAREYEKALPPLRRAAELSEDGNLYARLGQVHMQREEWSEAAAMLRLAIEKGGLSRPGNAVLLLGIAAYNDEKVSEALRHFSRARDYEDTRVDAENWMEHIQREIGSAPEAETPS